MKRVLGIVLIVAFAATLAMGVYVTQATAKVSSPATLAKMQINRHLVIQDMTRSQISHSSEIGRHEVMRLRPVDKRAIKLYSMKNARKIAAQASH
jgi:hypothetical protein